MDYIVCIYGEKLICIQINCKFILLKKIRGVIKLKVKDKSKILENLVLVSQIGISMTVPILGGIILGKYLDDLLGTKVVFLAIFSIFGIITSFISLFKITTRGTKRK